MNIPARYCTGYLGDTRPITDAPWTSRAGSRPSSMAWYTFDARNNIPRIGRVLIARWSRRSGCRHCHQFRAECWRDSGLTDR